MEGGMSEADRWENQKGGRHHRACAGDRGTAFQRLPIASSGDLQEKQEKDGGRRGRAKERGAKA